MVVVCISIEMHGTEDTGTPVGRGVYIPKDIAIDKLRIMKFVRLILCSHYFHIINKIINGNIM